MPANDSSASSSRGGISSSPSVGGVTGPPTWTKVSVEDKGLTGQYFHLIDNVLRVSTDTRGPKDYWGIDPRTTGRAIATHCKSGQPFGKSLVDSIDPDTTCNSVIYQAQGRPQSSGGFSNVPCAYLHLNAVSETDDRRSSLQVLKNGKLVSAFVSLKEEQESDRATILDEVTKQFEDTGFSVQWGDIPVSTMQANLTAKDLPFVKMMWVERQIGNDGSATGTFPSSGSGSRRV